MSDRWAAALAVAAVAGARLAAPVPVSLAVAALLVAAVARRPWALLLAAVLWSSLLSERAWAGLDAEVAPSVEGVATLVSDPEDRFGAVSADLRVGGRRYEAWARGAAGAALRQQLTGEEVDIRGRARPRPPDAPWLVARHVAGRLELDEARPAGPGAPWWRAANWVRRVLHRGAGPLPEHRRSLFTGLTVGDDREQPPEVAEDFRAAGLSHLLAVSGQNVAFLLVLVAPLLRRLSLAGRLPATLAALAFLALVTRFEPSVLRATVMAGLAVAALTAGRPVTGRRALCLAVTGLVLVDPLLAWSVGFALSVGASAGISLLAHRIRPLVPGPTWLADPLSVTVAAQAGVAPILVPVFGGVPLASLPANVLAVPAAGAVMVWGLPAGIVAGLAGTSAGALVHVPTSALLAWVAGVARVAARLPLGELALPGLAVATAGVLLVGRGRRRGRPLLSRLGWSAVAAALLLPAVTLRARPPPVADLGRGAAAWRLAGSPAALVAVGGEARAPAVLGGLQRADMRRIGVLVAESSGPATAGVIRAVRDRYRVDVVLVPRGSALPGGRPLTEAICVATAGSGRIAVRPEDERLAVGPGAASCDR